MPNNAPLLHHSIQNTPCATPSKIHVTPFHPKYTLHSSVQNTPCTIPCKIQAIIRLPITTPVLFSKSQVDHSIEFLPVASCIRATSFPCC